MHFIWCLGHGDGGEKFPLPPFNSGFNVEINEGLGGADKNITAWFQGLRLRPQWNYSPWLGKLGYPGGLDFFLISEGNEGVGFGLLELDGRGRGGILFEKS